MQVGNACQCVKYRKIDFLWITIWVRSRKCACIFTWFCYQMTAKPGNKTGPPSWTDLYVYIGVVICQWFHNKLLFTPAHLSHYLWWHNNITASVWQQTWQRSLTISTLDLTQYGDVFAVHIILEIYCIVELLVSRHHFSAQEMAHDMINRHLQMGFMTFW